MENIKRYVTDSGNTTLRGFFSSDAVDFDAPSLSARRNIMKANAKSIYDLADGATVDSEEDEIRDRMVFSQNSYELIRMMSAIDNWEGLDDELPEGHLDHIARQLAQVLDQRDYVPYQLVRRYLILLDYNVSPTLGDCFRRLLQWPLEFQPAEFDALLSRKAELLKAITSATMRERTNMINAAIVPEAAINQYQASTPHRSSDLLSLMHEVNYTTRICSSLRGLEFAPLYDVLTEMIDPAKSNVRRQACRDTCVRLALEFSAAAKATELLGDNEAKITVSRFMRTLKAATDNFPMNLPAPSAVAAILTALGSVGDTLSELRAAIIALPDIVTGITLPDLLGTSDDDKARFLITELNSQGWLARLAFPLKVTLVNSLLSGTTGDDDENAINLVLRAAKDYDQAELYQLVAAASWESLYSSVDGDEYDTMEGLLNALA